METINPRDLVVCVDASQPDDGWPPHNLVCGRYYRVRKVLPPTLDDPRFGLIVDGATPYQDAKSYEGFDAERFRKIGKGDEQFSEQVRACRPIRQLEGESL